MASVCMEKCVKDSGGDPRVPVRATYVNLHKWVSAESDAELIKTVRRVGEGIHEIQQQARPRVVDSISCRQMYLRSYTFSRKETVPEKTRKCFGKVKDKVVICHKKKKKRTSSSTDGGGRRRNKSKSRRSSSQSCSVMMRRVKEMSCGALYRIFRTFLSCAATVDVVDHHHQD